MSATPVVTPADLSRGARATAAPARPRIWIRALSFSGLALYGVMRWGRLLHDPPGWRLVGLAGLAIVLGVGLPLVRHLTDQWPARTGPLLRGLIVAAIFLGALPMAGLRWHWVWHAQIAVSARAIGDGLSALANVLVPYLGTDYSTRLVIMLGAAVLLLDAAAALAFAPREIGDGRRAAVALPLIALAVVPATLVRPAVPALQGLLLFGLLALFMWGERIARGGVGAAVGVACAAGVAGAIVGPIVDEHHPWVDYRAWAGPVTGFRLDAFDWNQTYGPLRWPQDGHVVLTVRADHSDYWKASDLTDFNGTAWVTSAPGAAASAPPLPVPTAALHHRRWTQAVQVTVRGMRTFDVIGGSGLTTRPEVAGGAVQGSAPGTWIAQQPLAPGDAYTVQSYSPRPTITELTADDGPYPWAALRPDLTLTLPGTASTAPGSGSAVPFPGFHQPLPAADQTFLQSSPYAPAYALAQRLAAESANPDQFVVRVMHFLDDGNYAYDQRTQSSRLPLLDFLFHSRIGYCQQFSGSMAMLLRMGGLPARVASGFTSGIAQAHSHVWTVTDIDAHAWVEVWFPHVGWVRFDPTPRTAPARGGSTTAAEDFHRITGGAPIAHPSDPAVSTSTTQTTPLAGAGAHHHGGGTGGSGGGDPWPWVGGGAGLLVALIAGWELAARLGVRSDPLAELERALSRTGRPLKDGTTLVALEHRFRSAPAAAAYIRALRLQRYGVAGEAPTPAGRRALRAELSTGLGVAGRLRGYWALPPLPPGPSAPLRPHAPRRSGGPTRD
jgi:transglutaminase-like putative cysteine protease